ncbi:hypothetical protein AGABI1DRAFT_69522 [Agaricus bisporus var. burnettii JB137-S8]|uniref:Major facilitator superfamily (MFS) profile domain-containing protein n=1 Tax=Agaricus bisporus var. burnettii (strain JB137-S8 / ATCC MYA-4627 / FGSC 10392) TaxID=597362 RepID=K5XIV1_AGABU|nr:uncharacterized protein AGABI1DRAFT_69522 [Agaricus bisporus var. burnettii JB137-S8]EKM83252.1 hypothetical protein AGABI1DRAFT_69522 [Agaricus bisporus var. burnettii JB137-S8]
MSEKQLHQQDAVDRQLSSCDPTTSAHALLDLKTALSKREKWFVVSLIALTAFLGPFTTNLYLPAIPVISRNFHKSIELINLTVTVYVIFQAITPMFFGPMSDYMGRRPVALICLLILALSSIGLALVPTSDYWLLMVLRCIQSTGASSTIAIGAGVISDISTAVERGGFYGVFSLGTMTGPTLGPVIGGALAQGLGWRSIFWFLCIAVSLCLLVLLLFLPETLPRRQHSHSKVVYTPIIPIVGRKTIILPPHATSTPTVKFQSRNPFPLFLKCNILFPLVLNAMSYAVYFAVVASLASLFEVAYPFLDGTRIGLCYLAIGGTMTLGTSFVGKYLDLRYKQEEKRLCEILTTAGDLENRLLVEGVSDIGKLPEFPIERARLKYLAEMVVILSGAAMGYGWCIERRVHLAVPLILQSIIGSISMTVMNATTTLLIDLAPGQGSAVSACTNFFRSTLCAIIISVIQPMIDGIGVGLTFVILGVLTLVVSLPCFYFEINSGYKWRAGRPPLKSSTAIPNSPANRQAEIIDVDIEKSESTPATSKLSLYVGKSEPPAQ